MNYDETTYTTYSASGPGHLSASAARCMASLEAYMGELTRRTIHLLQVPGALFSEPLRGEARVEHLGPEGREFKIVKLPGGKRVLVDQAAEVEGPCRINVSWAVPYPMIREPRHMVRMVCS